MKISALKVLPLFFFISVSLLFMPAAHAIGTGGDLPRPKKLPPEIEDVIYEKNSLYQFIKITESKRRGERYIQNTNRMLKQGGVYINEPDKLLFEYTRLSFIGLAFLEQEPKDALFIGMGAGVMPRYFHKYYSDTNIDSVEIDPDVYDVAKKYFFYKDEKTMKVYIKDGRVFMKKSKKKYDIIFLDAYQGGHIPFHLTTREFFQVVKKRLKPGGVIVANILAEDRNRFYYSMMKTYKKEFPHLYMFEGFASDNYIFVTRVEDTKIDKFTVWQNASKLQDEKKFDIYLPEMSNAYSYYSEDDNKAEILTDDFAPVNLYKHMSAD